MKKEGAKDSEDPSKCVLMLCSSDDVLGQILSEVRELKSCVGSRLTSLELQISVLIQTCSKISSRFESLEKNLNKDASNGISNEEHSQAIKGETDSDKRETSDSESQLKLIPLSSETDYPNGSWLGDPKCCSKRVRCPISSGQLLHINATCFAPEKMALTLLDNLFSKEELAISNISGRSRWGKKQLNPLFIFGIKCHLQHKFLITEKDWHRICQNMDAKCRFAWKRRFRSNNKEHKSKIKVCTSTSKEKVTSEHTTNNINFTYDNLNQTSIDFNNCVKVMSEGECELRILNATPDQIVHLQENRNIILAEEVLPESTEEKGILISNDENDLSMDAVVMRGDSLESDPLQVSMEEEEEDISLSKRGHHSARCQLPPITLKELQHKLLDRDCETDE